MTLTFPQAEVKKKIKEKKPLQIILLPIQRAV